VILTDIFRTEACTFIIRVTPISEIKRYTWCWRQQVTEVTDQCAVALLLRAIVDDICLWRAATADWTRWRSIVALGYTYTHMKNQIITVWWTEAEYAFRSLKVWFSFPIHALFCNFVPQYTSIIGANRSNWQWFLKVDQSTLIHSCMYCMYHTVTSLVISACHVPCSQLGAASSHRSQYWVVSIISHDFSPMYSHSGNRRHCLVTLNRVPRMS